MQKQKTTYNLLKGKHICGACGDLSTVCTCKKGTTTRFPAEAVTFFSVSEMNLLFGKDQPDYTEAH